MPHRDVDPSRPDALAQRVLSARLTGCRVVEVSRESEGRFLARCQDGQRWHLYAPLPCERESLLCAWLEIEAACWEVEAR